VKKLLFSLNPIQQCTRTQAQYWQSIGVQGFFLGNIMWGWDSDVGTNPASDTWVNTLVFQNTYANVGIEDNYIHVGVWGEGKDNNFTYQWTVENNTSTIERFGNCADLARAAGIPGIALDLEPYRPMWDGQADNSMIRSMGKQVARAMWKAYPDMTLFILPDVLRLQRAANAAYKQVGYFILGLLSLEWKRVVIGTELTYSETPDSILHSVSSADAMWHQYLVDNNLPASYLSIAPGLWPLGKSSTDNSPRETAQQFKDQLAAASSCAKDYTWIFGFNETWLPGIPPQSFVDVLSGK